MTLNGFNLSSFRRTNGREGEGFTAVLMLNSKAVATYEDYATGAMPMVSFFPNSYGKETVLSVTKEIKAANPSCLVDENEAESCAEFLCQILDECRDLESMYKKLIKDHRNSKYGALILSGDTWSLAYQKDDNRPFELGNLRGVWLRSEIDSLERAQEAIIAKIGDMKQENAFKRCCGFMAVDLRQIKPFEMTVVEYLQIFNNAKSV